MIENRKNILYLEDMILYLLCKFHCGIAQFSWSSEKPLCGTSFFRLIIKWIILNINPIVPTRQPIPAIRMEKGNL